MNENNNHDSRRGGNPYDERQERRNQRRERRSAAAADNINDFVNGAVQFGTTIGGTVLDSISEALNSVQDTMSGKGKAVANDFAVLRRKLDRKLSDSYAGFMVMEVFGWILFGCFGITALVMAILGVSMPFQAMGTGDFRLFRVLAGCFGACTALSFWMAWAGHKKESYFNRLRKYVRTMREWKGNLNDMARDSLYNTSKVKKDLMKAIANGHLPNACLDREQEHLYLDATLYSPAPPPSAVPNDAAPAAPTPQETFRQTGVDFLNYLKACQGQLTPEADEELDKMRKICAAILGFIHNHPAQIGRVRRFEEYYMPTTRKLLDTARGLGNADTDNAQEIRRDITGILSTLNTAYTQLYDTLLQEVSMDVSAEIDTLESILNQDGLTHTFENDFGKKSGR